LQSNNEIEFLDKKIAAINERREKLTQEFSQLQRVLEHTEADLAKVMGVC
jgi:prefoldin subunit 5